MNCNEVASKLQLFLDEELLFQDMEAIRKHLSLCPDCEGKSESEKLFKKTLREKFTRRPLNAGMVDDVKFYIMNRSF